jgi:23S rRNA (cytosine1962-C5)-methyltransferase
MSDTRRAVSSKPPVVELKTYPSPHPFVRRGLVGARPKNLAASQVVTVRVPGGDVLGDGFWNGTSDIALRLLTRGDVRFDRSALAVALDRAVSLRESSPGLTSSTNAWRVVHSEADELSGLVVDRYGDTLVVQLFSGGWLPFIDLTLELLHERLGTRHHRVGMSRRVAELEGVTPVQLRSPDCPTSLRIQEHGVRYAVDLETGHKTGFFCDQRDNRRQLARYVSGGDVLDMCCYTGGFGLSAAVLGEPASVTAVDLDEDALVVARKNANLNQVRLTLVHADAFDWMRQIGQGSRRFDTLILDPPKFIPSRSESERGKGKYHDLNRLALRLLRPGGLLLTCSCSGLLPRETFVELLRTAARKEHRQARILASGGPGLDHPVGLECPETDYLKTLWMRVW